MYSRQVNSLKAKLKQIKNLLPQKRVISVLEMNENSEPIIPERVQISKGVLLVPKKNMSAGDWEAFFKIQSLKVQGLKMPDDVVSALKTDQAILEFQKHQERQEEQKNQNPAPVNPNFAEGFKAGNTGTGKRVVESRGTVGVRSLYG